MSFKTFRCVFLLGVALLSVTVATPSAAAECRYPDPQDPTYPVDHVAYHVCVQVEECVEDLPGICRPPK